MSAGIRGWGDAVAGTFGGKMNNLKKIRMLNFFIKNSSNTCLCWLYSKGG